MFENHSENEVLADPNFAKYTNLGRGLENYFAITHPSQPNYWAITSGTYIYFFLRHSNSLIFVFIFLLKRIDSI